MVDIKIQNLSCVIENKNILKNINLTFDEGEIIGIIGKTGSGKTTLLKTLCGLNKKFTGEIKINGIVPEPYEKNRDISVLLDSMQVNLTKNLIDESVFEFILSARKSFKKFLYPYSDLDLQLAENYINILKLNDVRDTNIFSVSDSILKKTIIAFTLMKQSKIVILDNPDVYLDIKDYQLIQKALSRYVLDGDRMIIIASNNINLISQTADKIILLGNNGVITGGYDILTNDLIKENFDADVLISKNIYNGRPDIHLFPEK